MKFRTHQIFLSLFFMLAFCFSFSVETSAHDYQRSDGQHTYRHSENINISAADVDRADQAQMKKFVRHLATHLDLIKTDMTLDETGRQEQSREFVIFAREARETGPFNNGIDIYAMGVTHRGAITNHGCIQISTATNMILPKIHCKLCSAMTSPNSRTPLIRCARGMTVETGWPARSDNRPLRG